jgi:DNA-binding transcriptional MerR regulator
MTDQLTPAEMAEACEVSIDTLRYYEREGLLHAIERTDGGQRRYRRDDVAWVNILRCLRVTAMPIRDMRRFAELTREGDGAVPQRLALLQAHRESVRRQLAELDEALRTIDHKIEIYTELTTAATMPAVTTGGR